MYTRSEGKGSEQKQYIMPKDYLLSQFIPYLQSTSCKISVTYAKGKKTKPTRKFVKPEEYSKT